ncbi:MAG: sigma 54-interacting transcriptional regulator [Proteobacteria bacterium]|nr:sigma 54-interacting transcriptional regulator [Pseudomonadota bacterium]
MANFPAVPAEAHRERFLRSVVNYLDIFRVFDEGVIITDALGRVMFYNATQARIDGTRPADVLGLRATEVYDLSDDTSLIMQCLRAQEAIVNRHLVYRTRSGRIANSLCSVFPLFTEQGLVGAVCFVRDYNLVENTITSICAHGAPEGRPSLSGGTRFSFEHLIGAAPDFLACIKTAKMAALTPSPVMIYGETGTGKELFAQAMHNYGPRSGEAYVAINCAAIPENLLEGILFGTVRGAFTGAVDKQGIFEKANGGSLFLDEVNSMPVGLQAKLLRVVQERRVRRVGSLEEREVELKILSSVNEDPHAAIERGRLRLDLFYRLGVVLLRIPPLRERPADVPVLTRHFLAKHNAELGRQVEQVSGEVGELFRHYRWPGNVRELEHVVEGAMNVVGERNTIVLGDLPPYLLHGRRTGAPAAPSALPVLATPAAEPARSSVAPPGRVDLRREQEVRERAAVEGALAAARGNVSAAARRLGISRQLLRYKMAKHGLERSQFLAGDRVR